MNILTIEKRIIGTDRCLINMKSDLIHFSESKTIFINKLENLAHRTRTRIIHTYLSRYVKSRIRAYKAVGMEDSLKYENLNNFSHHLTTSDRKHAKDFYRFILNWESTLTNTLPSEVNASHDKIEKIISKCREHLESLS